MCLESLVRPPAEPRLSAAVELESEDARERVVGLWGCAGVREHAPLRMSKHVPLAKPIACVRGDRCACRQLTTTTAAAAAVSGAERFERARAEDAPAVCIGLWTGGCSRGWSQQRPLQHTYTQQPPRRAHPNPIFQRV